MNKKALGLVINDLEVLTTHLKELLVDETEVK